VGLLSPLTSELDRIAPSFDLCGDQIEVIQTPAQFYSTLKDRIRSARRRIFLSTLYIGKSERELLETVQQAMRDSPELKLSILTDALRGTREAPRPSCASLLAPLVEEFGAGRVEVRMYHTPNLTGLRKRTVPKRINEGWGLQHMKLYGIDDEIILSGYVTLETVEEMGICLANRLKVPICQPTTSPTARIDTISSNPRKSPTTSGASTRPSAHSASSSNLPMTLPDSHWPGRNRIPHHPPWIAQLSSSSRLHQLSSLSFYLT
jgi:hypothetical protein